MFPAESHKGGTRPCPEYLLVLRIDMAGMLYILLQSVGESNESAQPQGSLLYQDLFEVISEQCTWDRSSWKLSESVWLTHV